MLESGLLRPRPDRDEAGPSRRTRSRFSRRRSRSSARTPTRCTSSGRPTRPTGPDRQGRDGAPRRRSPSCRSAGASRTRRSPTRTRRPARPNLAEWAGAMADLAAGKPELAEPRLARDRRHGRCGRRGDRPRPALRDEGRHGDGRRAGTARPSPRIPRTPRPRLGLSRVGADRARRRCRPCRHPARRPEGTTDDRRDDRGRACPCRPRPSKDEPEEEEPTARRKAILLLLLVGLLAMLATIALWYLIFRQPITPPHPGDPAVAQCRPTRRASTAPAALRRGRHASGDRIYVTQSAGDSTGHRLRRERQQGRHDGAAANRPARATRPSTSRSIPSTARSTSPTA